MEKFEIVLVDDEKDILEFNQQRIKEKIDWADIVTFENPELAHPYISKNKEKIVLVISDLKMPEMTGIELREKTFSDSSEVPFLILTAFWDKKLAEDAMKYKVQGLLNKLDAPEVLISKFIEISEPKKEQLEEEREMIQGFIEESKPILDEIENLILELEETDDKMQILQVYFRLLHTVKGTASCVGLVNLGEYAHKYEDFIQSIRNGDYSINTGSTNVLLKGLDKLKFIFNFISEKGHDRLDIHNDLKVFINYNEKDFISNDVAESKTLNQTQKVETQDSSDKKEVENATVSMDILDEFLEESGELTVLRNAIVKATKKLEDKYSGDGDIENLNDLLEGMQKITANIQNTITTIRKVPIKTVFRPYKRLVRDLSKTLNKNIDLSSEGDDLMIDSRLAKLLNNTLIHLVRNAIDHGIETSEDRTAKGKEPKGHVHLKAFEKQEEIIIEIHDDGKGLSRSVLENKAIEKDIHTRDELENMSDQDVFGLIFSSGFSTAQQVTDISGRGVGMDMVKSSIIERGGNIIVDSTEGEGCIFTLKVPVPKSVLIVNSLLVSINDFKYVLPISDVVEIVDIDKSNRDKINVVEGKTFIRHHGDLLSILDVSELLFEESIEDKTLQLVIVNSKVGKYALRVQDVHEFEEVVVRKLHHNINNADFYKGASLLGDGDMALILDVDFIAQYKEMTLKKPKEVKQEVEKIYNIQYMQFDLNDGNSYAIGLDKVYRLEKINKSAIQYTGKLPVIYYRNKTMPLINVRFKLGLDEDDSSHLNVAYEELNVIVVKQANRLFGVVVNEISDIGESDSEIFTDLVVIDGILGSTYIKDKNVSVLDISYLTDGIVKETVIESNNLDNGAKDDNSSEVLNKAA